MHQFNEYHDCECNCSSGKKQKKERNELKTSNTDGIKITGENQQCKDTDLLRALFASALFKC
jgi:hypothetical protein